MTIAASDIVFRLSIPSATEGDADAQPDPADSRGLHMSTTALVDAVLENLFPNITGAEASDGLTRYACLFLLNNHATDTYTGAKIWFATRGQSALVSMGLDPVGVVAGDDTDPQAESIADVETAPDGVTFTAPTTEANALSIGNIPAGSCQAVWFRQVIDSDPRAMALDSAEITVSGTTS